MTRAAACGHCSPAKLRAVSIRCAASEMRQARPSAPPAPASRAKVIALRKKLKMSQSVFAAAQHTEA